MRRLVGRRPRQPLQDPPWLSDAICRSITGDSLIRRQLYSDSGLAVNRFQNTIIINGIDLGTLRGDLLDRSIIVELERSPETARRSDHDIKSQWCEARPRVHGALLTAAAGILKRLPEISLERKPRMADHALVLAALDQAEGTSTLPAYLGATKSAQTSILESSPIAAAIRHLIDHRSTWQGTATQLLAEITPNPPPKQWPATPQHLSGEIKRLLPGLRAIGIEMEFSRNADRSLRLITITKTPRE